jgi:hypothetical protein
MGEGNDRPLTVITGDRKTRQRRAGRRRALDQNEQITCWRCEIDTGIATSMAVRVILAPRSTPLGRLVSAPIVSSAARSIAEQILIPFPGRKWFRSEAGLSASRVLKRLRHSSRLRTYHLRATAFHGVRG